MRIVIERENGRYSEIKHVNASTVLGSAIVRSKMKVLVEKSEFAQEVEACAIVLSGEQDFSWFGENGSKSKRNCSRMEIVVNGQFLTLVAYMMRIRNPILVSEKRDVH